MEPSEKPVSPDAISLPPLCDAVVDEATLAQLEADLRERTQVHSVQVKQAAANLVGDDRWLLPAAFAALRQGQVRGIQIAYHHDRQEWTDTILRTGAGYRLIRIRHLDSTRS